VLQDQELELSHQLADDIRNLDTNYTLTQTNFNRRVAAEKQVEAVQSAYEAGTVTLDLLLEAQRRRADAEAAYYRVLVDYNKSIMFLHFRKGSLLEYNGVYLAEGPWPAKAYFDATRRARARDAAMYLDYGYTRPAVISQGPFEQFQHSNGTADHVPGEPTMATPPEEMKTEPTPAVIPGNEELPTPPMRTTRGLQGPRLSETSRPMDRQVVQASHNQPVSEKPAANSGAATLKIRGSATAPEMPAHAKQKDARAMPRTAAPVQARGKVQQASAEESSPFDWGAMAKEKATANAAAPPASLPRASAPPASAAGSSDTGWKSPNDESAQPAGASSGGWKSAR
jgi:hypothetical protein